MSKTIKSPTSNLLASKVWPVGWRPDRQWGSSSPAQILPRSEATPSIPSRRGKVAERAGSDCSHVVRPK